MAAESDGALAMRGKGRALYVSESGTAYVSRGYSLYRSSDWGRHWELDSFIRVPIRRAWRFQTHLVQRLFRSQLHTMELLDDGARVVVARNGLFRADPDGTEMELVFEITRGSRPLNLAVDGAGRLVWGEYGQNPGRREMHVYVSEDGGRTFSVAFTFPAGSIRHVHGLTYDPYLERFWVFTGDYDAEPGIGIFTPGLDDLTWIARGVQSCRAVQAIVRRDDLLFCTDTELETNAIVRLDKQTGRITRLRDVEGTSFFAEKCGAVMLISTVVEPSKVNRSRHAVVYASLDGESWKPVLRRVKDRLPHIFQLGTIVLAKSRAHASRALISGQSVSGMDNRVGVLDFVSNEDGEP